MNTTTWAIIVDAYRDLNSRKIFWIVFYLSLVAIAAFGLVGVSNHSITVMGWAMLPNVDDAEYHYKKMFSLLVVGFYFTFIAAILALVSTASIFPEFMAGGAIDLYLSKTIGRTRLFMTKYLAGLLFVTLQVSVFTLGSFLVMGIRGHVWLPSLFLAIPIVVTFFSYLYGICVLLGVLTRSTLASLLLTILVWMFIAAVDYTDVFMTQYVEAAPFQEHIFQREIGRIDDQISTLEADKIAVGKQPATTQAKNRLQDDADQLDRLQMRRQMAKTQLQQVTPGAMSTTIQKVVVTLKTFVPKTRETTALLDRYLLPDEELQKAANRDIEDDPTQKQFSAEDVDPMRKRSVWWIVGTSLGFEALCVGLAAWIFKRRDF